MIEHLLTPDQKRVVEDARAFVKDTPRQLILDMDADKVRFPKDWLREAAKRTLLGVRHPIAWGCRGMDWVTASAVCEEIGSLSYGLACVFGVGADLVCDAIIRHGTDAQRERYVTPLLAGEIFAAECLTEPRGGSDFFGATTTAKDCGDHFLLNGQKRFIVGAEGADYFLVYARTNPDPKAPPQQSITCFIGAVTFRKEPICPPNATIKLDKVWSDKGQLRGNWSGITFYGDTFLNSEWHIQVYQNGQFTGEYKLVIRDYRYDPDVSPYWLYWFNHNGLLQTCQYDAPGEQSEVAAGGAAFVLGNISVYTTSGLISNRLNTVYLACQNGAVGKAVKLSYLSSKIGTANFTTAVRVIRAAVGHHPIVLAGRHVVPGDELALVVVHRHAGAPAMVLRVRQPLHQHAPGQRVEGVRADEPVL